MEQQNVPVDSEIWGTMEIDGKLVCAYDQKGEPVFLAKGWDLVDGKLIQKEIHG